MQVFAANQQIVKSIFVQLIKNKKPFLNDKTNTCSKFHQDDKTQNDQTNQTHLDNFEKKIQKIQ